MKGDRGRGRSLTHVWFVCTLGHMLSEEELSEISLGFDPGFPTRAEWPSFLLSRLPRHCHLEPH